MKQVKMPFLPGNAIKQVIEEESSLSASKEASIPEIVFFGRMEGRKGVQLFCDALDILAKEFASEEPNFKITFLGRQSTVDGESSQDYISTRAENGAWPFEVKIVSTLGRAKALRYLASGNRLAVIPSLFDNAPYTVYECLYAKIPFIASNTNSIAPLVSDSKALFDVDANSLSAKIAESLQTLGSTGKIKNAPRK
jgi:glycosyltransferase involved in cell wall biosynthesis